MKKLLLVLSILFLISCDKQIEKQIKKEAVKVLNEQIEQQLNKKYDVPEQDRQVIQNNQYIGTVRKVSDGDTVTLDDGTKKGLKVRLYGIDAPESQQSFGTQSKEFLSNKLLGKEVKLDIKDTDQYGRKVAIIYLGDENINELMIKEGWAWWYEQYAKNEIVFRDLQEEARKNKNGLWRKNGNVAPWEYRKEKRNKNKK